MQEGGIPCTADTLSSWGAAWAVAAVVVRAWAGCILSHDVAAGLVAGFVAAAGAGAAGVVAFHYASSAFRVL